MNRKFMIRLSKQLGYFDRVSKYKIFIESAYNGRISNGEIKEIDTGIRQHIIYLIILNKYILVY